MIYAASAVGANTICRSIFGSVAPLFTEQMCVPPDLQIADGPRANVLHRFEALGIGPAASLIAGVGCLLAPIPFLYVTRLIVSPTRSTFATICLLLLSYQGFTDTAKSSDSGPASHLQRHLQSQTRAHPIANRWSKTYVQIRGTKPNNKRQVEKS